MQIDDEPTCVKSAGDKIGIPDSWVMTAISYAGVPLRQYRGCGGIHISSKWKYILYHCTKGHGG